MKRGIADTLHKNGALPQKLASRDIYLGAIPWVAMQLVLVGAVIAFPQMVTLFLDQEQAVDSEAAIRILQDMGARNTPAAVEAGPGVASDPAAKDPLEAVRRAIEDDKK